MRALRFLPVFFLAITLVAVTWTSFAQYGEEIALVNYTLTVDKQGSGSGTVTSNPSGINCGTDCSQDYLQGTAVTLTASPSFAHVFTNWSGCNSVTVDNKCNVTMNAAKTVTATFEVLRVLTVTKSGTGTVTSDKGNPVDGTKINCGGVCATSFANNTQVTLTATTQDNFTGWSGDCTGTAATTTVTMTAAKNCTATFSGRTASIGVEVVPISYTLTVAKTGTGTVKSSPAGIDCGNTCAKSFVANTAVTLTATPAADSTFTGADWTGCVSVTTDKKCNVSLTSNKTITAKFTLKTTPPAGCGNETVAGRCDDDEVIWCDTASQTIQRTNCENLNQVCGFDPKDRIYTCLPGVVVAKPECDDDKDNDNDNKIDYPVDPGCTSASDNSEADVPPAGQCPLYALYGAGRENYLTPGVHKIKPWLKDNIKNLQETVNAYTPLPTTATYPSILGKSLAKLAVDGFYGGLTLDAVWEYQYRNGLKPDRIVGPLTTAALNADYLACLGGEPPVTGCAAGEYPVPVGDGCGTAAEIYSFVGPLLSRTETIRPGSTLADSASAKVAAKLLFFLKYAASDYSTSATWSSPLVNAVISFQRDNFLTVDGFFGRNSRNALLESYLVKIGLLTAGAPLPGI